MFEFLLVVLTIASPVLCVSFLSRYLQYKAQMKKDQIAMQRKVDLANASEHESQIALLQERVATLEKIVTDRSFELSERIAKIA